MQRIKAKGVIENVPAHRFLERLTAGASWRIQSGAGGGKCLMKTDGLFGSRGKRQASQFLSKPCHVAGEDQFRETADAGGRRAGGVFCFAEETNVHFTITHGQPGISE